MRANEFLIEKWSQKYKNSINCSHPKGFSQKAHCAGKRKHNEDVTMEMTCPDCGMCQTHGNINEIKKGAKDANGYTRCWPGKHAEGTKQGKNGPVRNCVPNESVTEGHSDQQRKVFKKNGHPVGEVGIDRESSPGVGQYYMKHYASGKDLAGYDSYEEAVAELKHCMKQGVAEGSELAEEFDLIESVIDNLALHNGVDAEVIWEDLESLTDDELYVFAVTQEPIMESITESRGGNYEQMGYRKSNKDKFALLDRTLDAVILTTNNLAQAKQEAIEWAEYDDIRTEVIQQDIGRRVFTVDGYAGAEKYLDESEAWQKANKKDRTDGMSRKAVKSYRREHPGSKLQTAVTTKPSKLKKGSKASKRRKSYCLRSKGQMKMHNISCAKTPDKAICKARRRWNC